MKKKLYTLAVTLLLTLILAGCSSTGVKVKEPAVDPNAPAEGTIAAFFNNDTYQATLQAQMKDIVAQNSTVYSDAKVELKDNDVTYHFYYTSDYDDKADKLKEAFTGYDWEPVIAQEKASMKAVCDIEPENIYFCYYTSKGDLIFSNLP